MWMMRNALAHGGVHFTSRSQDPFSKLTLAGSLGRGRDDQIDQVYFVSMTDDKQGTEVLRVSLDNLEIFWTAWVELLTGNLQTEDWRMMQDAA